MSNPTIFRSIDPATWIPTTDTSGSGLHWPRGFRLGNPGHIDYNPKQLWQGLYDPPLEPKPFNSSRRRFCRFVAAVWGIRAIFRVLITYRDRMAADGTPVDTIAEIIARWAPAIENNVVAYVNQVDRHHPAGANDILDVRFYEDAMPLAKAIVNHELGNPAAYGLREWYPQVVWDRAADLAGLKRRKPKAMSTDPSVVGPAVAGAALGLDAVAPYIPMVEKLVQPGSVAANALVFIAIGAVTVVLWKRLKKRKVESA